MRPIAHFALYAVAAAAIAAFATTGAAAGTYMKLGSIKGGEASAGASHGGQIEIESWSWGQYAATGPASGDMTLKGSKIRESAPPPAPAASVVAAEPLDRGSVTVRARLPGCRAGQAFADAELTTADARYEFKDVIITSCATGGSAGIEQVSFNYGQVSSSPVAASKVPTTITKCVSPGSPKPQKC